MLSKDLEKKYNKKLKELSISDLKIIMNLASDDEVSWSKSLTRLYEDPNYSISDENHIQRHISHWNDVANLVLQEIATRMEFFYDEKTLLNKV